MSDDPAQDAFDECHEVIHDHPTLCGVFIILDKADGNIVSGTCGLTEQEIIWLMHLVMASDLHAQETMH